MTRAIIVGPQALAIDRLVAAIAAEETVYNTADDTAIQDASWHKLQALRQQLSAAIREARGDVSR